MLDEEGPRHGGRDAGVVHQPEVVLQGGDPGDERSGLVAERLANELQGVAQPFGRDPEVMERFDVRPAQDGLVAAHPSYAAQIRDGAVSRTRCG